MNKYAKVIITTSCLMFASASFATATAPAPASQGEYLAQKLHLTDAQKQQIENLQQTTKNELSSINVDGVKKDLILNMIKSGKWDEQAARQQLADIGNIQAQASYDRAEYIFKVSQVLTKEQKQQLQTMMKQQAMY